ncbi:MAG: hypothetical protein K2G36_02175 [Ruminococcus sp.]|nr:hypothetical protein [Ruminococcus sp.]
METEIKKIVCSVCGKESEHTVITKIEDNGIQEMDLRPTGEHRQTMDYWVMECPECGYCNGTLETPLDADREYLESDEYKTLDGVITDNVLVSKFVRKALVCMKNKDYAEAVKSYVYSAWVSDDERDVTSSLDCRNKAIRIMEKKSLLNSEDMMLLRADLLRRSGQFEKVIKEYGMKQFINPFIMIASQYEVRLSRERDLSAHSMSDIPSIKFET